MEFRVIRPFMDKSIVQFEVESVHCSMTTMGLSVEERRTMAAKLINAAEELLEGDMSVAAFLGAYGAEEGE